MIKILPNSSQPNKFYRNCFHKLFYLFINLTNESPLNIIPWFKYIGNQLQRQVNMTSQYNVKSTKYYNLNLNLKN